MVQNQDKDLYTQCVDFKNSPYHVFGIHTNCKSYFCTKISCNLNNFTPKESIEATTKYVQQCLKPLVHKKSASASHK